MIQRTDANTEGRGPLLELLADQERLAIRLTELSRRQAELVREGRNEELLSLLARRQSVLDAFLAAQSAFAQQLQQLGAGEGERTAIHGAIERIETRLEHVLQSDDRHRETLAEKVTAMPPAEALRRARAAYGTEAAP